MDDIFHNLSTPKAQRVNYSVMIPKVEIIKRDSVSYKISMFKKNNAFYYYIICIVFLYAVWKLYKKFLYENIEALSSFGTYLNYKFGELYVKTISLIFAVFNIKYTTFIEYTTYGKFPAIALESSRGIYVAYHCLGFTVLYLYVFTLLLLQGDLKRKIKYILWGCLSIFIVNTFRLLALVILREYANDMFFELNHSVIFVVLEYSVLLIFHLMYLRRGNLV